MEKNKTCNCPEPIQEIEANSNENTNSYPNLLLDDTSEQTASLPNDFPPVEDEDIQMSNEAFGAATWYDNKKISSLWSKDETRNSWVNVSGLGWKKLNNSNNASCVSLSILSAHSKQFDRTVKFKIEDNLIKEMYVW